MGKTLISKINETINNGNEITVGTSFGENGCCCYSVKFVPDDLSIDSNEITIFNGADFVSICTDEETTQIEYDEDNDSFFINGVGWATIVEF